jgi:hypothetical protein
MESKQNTKPTKGLMMMMITITQKKTLTASFFLQMRDEFVIENNFCSLSVFLTTERVWDLKLDFCPSLYIFIDDCYSICE